MKYARCTHTLPSITAYLIEAVGGPSSNSVSAVAIATTAHAQSTCPIPVGLNSNGPAPNYGYAVGQWVDMLYDPTHTPPSELGWYNLDGSTDAKETRNELAGGYCGSSIGNTVGTPGAKVTADDLWNSRFGIYKNNYDPTVPGMAPDFTGYVYTPAPPSASPGSWPNPSPQNAYNGTVTTGGSGGER